MLIVVKQVVILFMFVFIGYILGKTKLANPDHTKILSIVTVYVFLPCNIFKTFMTNFTPETVFEKFKLLLISLGVIVVLAVGMHFLSKLLTKAPYQRMVYRYSLIIPNYAYIGYPLAEGLFGGGALMDVIICSPPLSIYANTVGYASLTKTKLSLKRIFRPIIVAIILGLACGMLKLKLPEIVMDIINKNAACMSPVSLLLSGIVISQFTIKSLFNKPMNYVVALIRLIVVPAVVFFAVKTIFSAETALPLFLLYAMPCGFNTIIFARIADENCETGASLAITSLILSCLTIPLLIQLFGLGGLICTP